MMGFGVLFVVLGVALAGFAFVTGGAMPGEQVVNISLLNLKAMLATVGGAMFVGGTVLIGAAGVIAVGGLPVQRASDAEIVRQSNAPGEKPHSAGAWRETHTIVRSQQLGGTKVYYLNDDTVAVDGLDRTFPDAASALAAIRLGSI